MTSSLIPLSSPLVFSGDQPSSHCVLKVYFFVRQISSSLYHDNRNEGALRPQRQKMGDDRRTRWHQSSFAITLIWWLFCCWGLSNLSLGCELIPLSPFFGGVGGSSEKPAIEHCQYSILGSSEWTRVYQYIFEKIKTIFHVKKSYVLCSSFEKETLPFWQLILQTQTSLVLHLLAQADITFKTWSL